MLNLHILLQVFLFFDVCDVYSICDQQVDVSFYFFSLAAVIVPYRSICFICLVYKGNGLLSMKIFFNNLFAVLKT